MGDGPAEIKGTIEPTTGKIDATVIPVKEHPLITLGRKINRFVRGESTKMPSATTEEAARELESAIVATPDTVIVKDKSKSGKTREIRVDKTGIINKIVERWRPITDRRRESMEMMEEYLGRYGTTTGEFEQGGVEGDLEGIVRENEAVLKLAKTHGRTGYSEFSQAMRAVIEAKTKMEGADGKFSRLNKGKSFINLNELNTQEKRVDWMIKTFGMARGTMEGKNGEEQRRRIISLWQEAYAAENKPAQNPQEREKNRKEFMNKFNKVEKSDQVIIFGLMKMTQAQGIDNFLGDAVVFKDKDKNVVEGISLGGEHFKTIQTQYCDIVMAFVNSMPFTSGFLRWDQERGLLIPNISLAARAMIRDATDFISEDTLKELAYVDKNGGDLLGYLLERRAPHIKGKLNPWERLVALAEFQTTYYDKFRGSKDLSQRMAESRYEGAEFGDMANGDIIKNHWFERIPYFKEAVAKHTSLGADALQYDVLRDQAVLAKDKLLVQEIEAAEVYAKQFLQMCGAPVGGISKDYMQTFQQIMDTTVSSRSGPLDERVAGEDGREFRSNIEKAIIDKNYTRTEVRVNEETRQQEIVLKIPDAGKGVFTIPMKNAATLTLVGNGGQPLIDYLLEKGFYKEAGYWEEYEKTVGPGFSVYARDWAEYLGGLLTRSNINYYEKREIGRRLGELYNGNERHKRVFIQFLLERKQQVGGSGWERSFEQENSVPFDPFNDVHVRLLAQKMGMEDVSPSIETIVSQLANARDEKFWGNLFFDPLNENHLNKIYSVAKDGKQVDLGFDRFYVNTWWAFDSISKLRNETLTYIKDLKVHGVVFENGEWTDLTYEKLLERVANWKHCASTQERLETLGYLTQRLNEAQTEKLMKLIRTPKHPITHEQLDTVFEHGLWRVAQLTGEEKDNVLEAARTGREIRVVGETVEPLTQDEAKEGWTILGKAMEIKGKRMRLNIRAALDQSLFWDLVSQPGVSLQAIYQKLIDQHMFEYCLPLLTRGDIERINENSGLYPMLPLSDPESYRLIEGFGEGRNPDPRYVRMRDYILGALYVTSSMAVEDDLKLKGINARDIAWDQHSAYGNQGLWLSRVKALWGINNVMPLNDQFNQIYDSLRDVNWTELDGEYAYLPDVVIRFAREFYGVDVLSKEEVNIAGGEEFLKQFKEVISDPNRLMFVMFGVRMTQPHLLPAKYENYYKQTIGDVLGDLKKEALEDKKVEAKKPEWFNNIDSITVRRKDGRVEKISVTYDTVVRKIKDKWLREPVYGPWPDVPMPHIEVDKAAVRAASFLDVDRPIGEQMIDIVTWMQSLADLPVGAEIPETVRNHLIPQLERYALTYMRQVDINGEDVLLTPLNIRKLMPEVVRQFKDNLGTSRSYNLNFMGNYLLLMYGIDTSGAKKLVSINGLKSELKTLYGDVNFSGFQAMLQGRIEELRNPDKFKFLDRFEKTTASIYLYTMRDRLQFGMEGPSTLYKLVKIAMDRNFGYYLQKIFDYRTQYLGLLDEEKNAMFEKIRELADFETAKLVNPKGSKYTQEAFQVLKKYGFESPQEIGLFVGAIQAEGKTFGEKELHTVLYSDIPTDFEPFFEKGLLKAYDALGKSLATKEAVKFILKEKENQHWHFQAYQPLIGLDFPFTLLAGLGLKVLEPVSKAIQKTPLCPKVGSLYLLPFLGLPSFLGGALLAAASAPSAEIAGATILSAIGQIPSHLFSFQAFGGLGGAYMLSGIIHGAIIVPLQFRARRDAGQYAVTIGQYFGKIFSKQGGYF